MSGEQHIDEIISEHYFTAADGVRMKTHPATPISMRSPLHLVTFCILILKNGSVITGESTQSSLENLDIESGRRMAKENAVKKIGFLESDSMRYEGN
jgi:hypothetical protein